MFSRTVISRSRLWFCGTWTTPDRRIWRGDLPVSRSPSSVISPSRGLSSPLMVDSRVDFPAPFGPTTQVIPPCMTWMDTPRRTSPPPYPATTPATSSVQASCARPGDSGCGAVIVFLCRSEVGVKHAAVVADHVRRAGDHRVPVVEDGHLVTQPHHELHVVLHDEERGPTPVQRADPLGDGADQGRVHPTGGLVEQDDLRFGDQHVGQLQQLALTVGQGLGAVTGQFGYPGELQQLHRPLAGGCAARPGERVAEPPGLPGPLLVVRGHDHVLHDGQPGEDPGQLERPADTPREDLVRGQAGDLGFVEVDVAAVHPPVAGDHVEQGGLPGAVRPDQPGDTAAFDLDRAVMERLHPAVRLRDALRSEQRRHDALPVVGSAGLPAAAAPTGRPDGGPVARSVARRCRLARRAVSFSPTVGRIPRGRKMMTIRNSAPRTIWAAYVLVTCCWAQPRYGSSSSAPKMGPARVPNPPRNAIRAMVRSKKGLNAYCGSASDW